MEDIDFVANNTDQHSTAQASTGTEELGQARAGSNAAANIELTVDELI